jgi:hypothetical protein
VRCCFRVSIDFYLTCVRQKGRHLTKFGPVGLRGACHGINLYSAPVRPQPIHGNEETFTFSSAS